MGEAICDCRVNVETLPLATSPSAPNITHKHTHTPITYLLPAAITTSTQQNTTMCLTLCASPAILGVAAASPKMAPSECARSSRHPGALFVCPLAWHRRIINPLAVQMALEALG